MLSRTGKYASKRNAFLFLRQLCPSNSVGRFNSTEARGFDFLTGGGKATTKDGLTFSTGIMGHLSESSIICKQGGSVLHAVVNSARSSDATDNFLPLTVDYRSRQYAFGSIPTGGRRERHGGDDEVLVARCIDRAVRPLFPKGYVNEVQLLVTAHAADGVHDPTIAAVNAASFALLKSKQPWYGPIGCVRVGIIDGQLKVDPTLAEMEHSTLDLVYAGTEGRALMVEAIGQQIPDATIQQAMALADTAVVEIIRTQRTLMKQLNDAAEEEMKAQAALHPEPVETEIDRAKKAHFTVPPPMAEAVKNLGYDRALQVYSNGIAEKVARGRSEGKLRAELLETVAKDEIWGAEPVLIRSMAVDGMMHQAFRDVLLCKHLPASTAAATTDPSAAQEVSVRRSDGRSVDEVRKVSAAVEVLPTVHGSSYFARGDTHVLSTVTLGKLEDQKEFMPIDGTAVEKKQPFILHYDFPPYSTGEMGNSTAPNRRMVGHGNLAEKGIRPVMPSVDEFPYTVRVYCECTGSNGSSSMASVCAGSLALFDAGVPLKAPVAAVSVGLVTDESVALDFDDMHNSTADKPAAGLQGKEFVLLKDILGSEDHHGDMDYKIAGTDRGITAIQLDTKLPGGVPLRILDQALQTAHEGRLHILQHMHATLPATRSRVKPQAPKAEIVSYDEDRIGLLIGPRGDMKEYMEELYNVSISLDSPGKAYIYGADAASVAACSKLVQDIAVLVKEGDTVSATVSSVLDYGVIVTINRAQQALLHVHELSHDTALLKRPTVELVQVGQRFHVKIQTVDKATGVVKVSRKALLDMATSVPDTIRSLEVEDTEQDLPTFATSTSGLGVNKDAITFPTSPPRPYTTAFFTNNVVSDQEVELAVRRQQGIGEASSSATPSAASAIHTDKSTSASNSAAKATSATHKGPPPSNKQSNSNRQPSAPSSSPDSSSSSSSSAGGGGGGGNKPHQGPGKKGQSHQNNKNNNGGNGNIKTHPKKGPGKPAVATEAAVAGIPSTEPAASACE